MKRIGFMFMIIILLFSLSGATIPDKTSVAGKCMTCHKEKSPGLYKQWFESSHATHNVTCLDCHQAKKGEKDSYTHYDATIATLVTPKDCGNCHEREAEETQRSYHATAGEILDSNDAYMAHVAGGAPVAIVGCESCHGAKVEIDPDSENRLSAKSWPNSGIGRLNPDGSKGSCTACHTRHSFSLSQARQPESCSKCHLGPDHPQKEVYEESKHGNAFFTNKEKMNLHGAAWVVGVDYYYAPTCATCHISMLADGDGSELVGRSHQMTDRLPWRLFGLIYAHPQPKSPDTTVIRNAVGITAPTDFKGNFATAYLIDEEEMAQRTATMQAVCLSCHGRAWVGGHFKRLDNAIAETNHFVRASTGIMEAIWEAGLARPDNPMDEIIEKKWMDTWLFYGNTIRFASAMAGGGDYGVYAGGRYQLNQRITELEAWYQERNSARKAAPPAE